ncbi:MAG: hypothetical protein ACI3V3_01320, partial [Faecousia sp.]
KNFEDLISEVYHAMLGIGRELVREALEQTDAAILAERDVARYRDGNTHKCNGLRLHPCLVESDDGPMKPMDYENGRLKDPRQRCDCLDELSLHLYKLSGGARKEDLKLWDCPYMEQEDGTINLS